MPKKELAEFLLGVRKEKALSLRRLSINAGLSPGAVHSIINREYEPTLYSLNRLADYLGVKRQYMWYLAGLLEDMDYAVATKVSDPRLKFHFAKADKLPDPARNLIISIVSAIITYFEIME
ncbi:hypothetical protein ES707_04038 [subsurface metagenome]